MAEGNYELALPKERLIQDGHEVIYNLRFQDFRERAFYTHEHIIQCRTMPTSWKIELTCKRLPELSKGCYKFSAKLKRTDHSRDPVKAVYLHAMLFKSSGSQFFLPINCDKCKMARYEVLEGELRVTSAEIINIASVTVTITIKGCHIGARFFDEFFDLFPGHRSQSKYKASTL